MRAARRWGGAACAAALAGAVAAAVAWAAPGESDGVLPDPERLEGEARLEAAVAEKLAKWRGRREAACRERALAEARAAADSMILDYARARALQLERPSRPVRPETPPLRRPSDTLALRPFLRDTL